MTLSHKDKPTVMGEAVSQRALDAADPILEFFYGKHRKPKGTYGFVVQAFARFERELSTNKDETIAKLEAALIRCRDQFEFYVRSHMAKTPPDMDKAATNQEFVELCDAALTSTKKEG